MTMPANDTNAVNPNEESSHRPIDAAGSGDEQFATEMLAVFEDAKYGLSEDEILAVTTMRRERAAHEALEALLLNGALGAALEGPRDRMPTVGDFRFWLLTEEEAVERRRPANAGSAVAESGLPGALFDGPITAVIETTHEQTSAAPSQSTGKLELYFAKPASRHTSDYRAAQAELTALPECVDGEEVRQ